MIFSYVLWSFLENLCVSKFLEFILFKKKLCNFIISNLGEVWKIFLQRFFFSRKGLIFLDDIHFKFSVMPILYKIFFSTLGRHMIFIYCILNELYDMYNNNIIFYYIFFTSLIFIFILIHIYFKIKNF